MCTHRSRHLCTQADISSKINPVLHRCETVSPQICPEPVVIWFCSLFPVFSLSTSSFPILYFLISIPLGPSWCSSQRWVLTNAAVCANSLDKIHSKTDYFSDRTPRRKQITRKPGYSWLCLRLTNQSGAVARARRVSSTPFLSTCICPAETFQGSL